MSTTSGRSVDEGATTVEPTTRTVPVINPDGSQAGTVELPSADFDVLTNVPLIHQVVVAQLAAARQGTHSTKNRGEVRGGGRKPYKQKGTGRARQGSTRSPQWRHGGVVFGPKPRSYETSLNKKERAAAMHAALTDRFASGSITVLATEGFEIEKTAAFASLIFGSPKAAKTGTKTLVVFAEDELATIGVRIARAGSNLPKVGVTHTGALDVKDVLGYARIVLTTGAYDRLASAFAHRAGKLTPKAPAEPAPVQEA